MFLGLSVSKLLFADTELVHRFLPQGGTWDVADVQWNPHLSRREYIVSTSSEKLCASLFRCQIHTNVHRKMIAGSFGTSIFPAKLLLNISSGPTIEQSLTSTGIPMTQI